MSETVYLLGAGVNRGLTNAKGLMPPLDGDFFQLLADRGEALPSETIPRGSTLSHYRTRRGGKVPPLEQASDPGQIRWVYGFIQQFWQRSPQSLAKESLSLEELLTFLQLSQTDAQRSKNHLIAEEYLFVEWVLEHRLLSYLNEFANIAKTNQDMARLGRTVYAERSTVITTNYDLILETVIDQAADEDSKSSSNKNGTAWSARDAYRCRFGYPAGKTRQASPIRPMVLKLHGSLNWGSLVSTRANPPKVEKTIAFLDKYPDYYLRLEEGFVYKPLIVPMILYKNTYYEHSVIRAVWSEALKEISKCQKLVVIGYSFPPTDFRTRKLLMDALLGRSLKELVVVNPDTSVVQTIKGITHFRKPVAVCRDIGEFLR